MAEAALVIQGTYGRPESVRCPSLILVTSELLWKERNGHTYSAGGYGSGCSTGGLSWGNMSCSHCSDAQRDDWLQHGVVDFGYGYSLQRLCIWYGCLCFVLWWFVLRWPAWSMCKWPLRVTVCLYIVFTPYCCSNVTSSKFVFPQYTYNGQSRLEKVILVCSPVCNYGLTIQPETELPLLPWIPCMYPRFSAMQLRAALSHDHEFTPVGFAVP